MSGCREWITDVKWEMITCKILRRMAGTANAQCVLAAVVLELVILQTDRPDTNPRLQRGEGGNLALLAWLSRIVPSCPGEGDGLITRLWEMV